MFITPKKSKITQLNTGGEMKYELIMWVQFFLKSIPGKIGCKIRKLLLPSKIGRGTMIWDNVQIDFPSSLCVCENTSINRGTVINAGGGISIGSNVFIGPNVTIYSQNHCYGNKKILINEQGYERKKVIIEDDVWLAANSVILPGVTVGKGAVVAAGSVVTKNVEAYSVVAGVPARKFSSRS